ncbi:hypothetical protein TNCV_2923041 [Trichonephila clavipes]|nr:hypothetical protein TNCV_2923041 [Trichonephila clavipes]
MLFDVIIGLNVLMQDIFFQLSCGFGIFVSLQCRLEDQPIPGWPCGANRYFQATPIILLLMLTNALSVLGACQSLDARRGGSRSTAHRVEKRPSHLKDSCHTQQQQQLVRDLFS